MSKLEKLGDVIGQLGTGKATRSQETTSVPDETSDMVVEQESDEERYRKQREAELRAMNIYSFDHTFEKFNQLVKGTRETYEAFKALANGETGKPFLLCYGGVGSGKTHLSEALILRMRERGYLCRYNKVTEMLSLFRSALSRESYQTPVEVLISRYCEARVLLLDDYGVEYGSKWEMSIIEDLIDERYRARRITILCTNLDISELPERIASRFSDPEVSVKVLNGAGDYRRRRLKK